MRANDPNLLALAAVARAMGDIVDEVAFVGGTSIPLHVDDPTVGPTRFTRDVDCVAEIATYVELARFEERLRLRGFSNGTEDGDPLCRYRKDAMILDVVSTDATPQGFTNRWYREGMQSRLRLTLPTGESVFTFALGYLLCTKWEAFRSRGDGDWYGSHDLEDIVALVEGTSTFLEAGSQISGEAQRFLVECFDSLVAHKDVDDILAGHLGPHVQRERRRRLITRIAAACRAMTG